MKALLIAEKPSLRRNIEAVYNKYKKEMPYEIDFMDQRGHLLTLVLPDEMDSKLELLKGAYQATDEGEFTQRIPWMDNQVFYKPMDLDENNKK